MLLIGRARISVESTLRITMSILKLNFRSTVIKQQRNSHTLSIFIVGLVFLTYRAWRCWRSDRALADRLRATRSRPALLSRTPRVSVLVAAWNEQSRIEAHIRSFMALGYPSIELILCAGGSDGTLDLAREYAGERVTVLEQRPGEGKQIALARCMQYATGEIIYLTDADCLYDDKALAALLAPLIEEGEQAATGGSRPLDRQLGALLPGYISAADVFSRVHAPLYVQGLLGRNAAVTRQAIEKIGGLSFPARTGTDYQLAQRLIYAGVAIRHVADSVVQSEFPETLQVYRHKQSRWLRNLLLHGRRYGAVNDVRATLRTVLTGVFMLAAPVSSLLLGRLVLVLWGLLVSHATLSKLRYVLFTARLQNRAVPVRLILSLLPLTLADFAIWALPIVDLAIPGRRERW